MDLELRRKSVPTAVDAQGTQEQKNFIAKVARDSPDVNNQVPCQILEARHGKR